MYVVMHARAGIRGLNGYRHTLNFNMPFSVATSRPFGVNTLDQHETALAAAQ
jgi:hypothetical protein